MKNWVDYLKMKNDKFLKLLFKINAIYLIRYKLSIFFIKFVKL